MLKRLFLLILCITANQFVHAQCPNIIPTITINSIVPTIGTDTDTGEDIFYFDVCQGDSIVFEGAAVYDDGTEIPNLSEYTWTNNGGSFQTGNSTSYNFPNSGGYEIELNVEDDNGCVSTVVMKALIRVSTTPIITLTADPTSICPNQNSELQANSVNIEAVAWSSPPCVDDFSEPLYLPDGNGVSYETEININCFLPGQTITSISDLLSININIEHSYTGDLDISLTAPNGSEVVLFNQSGGPNWFGEATDNDSSPNNPGVGYDYGWSMNPTYDGTMDAGMWDNTTTTGGFFGNEILNSGTYLPVGNFNSYIGTPINGTWTLTVTDNMPQDNGWVFSWSIEISPDITPATLDWGFTPTIVSNAWGSAETTVAINGDQMTVNPPEVGTYNYNYTVIDDFGCEYSESVQIEAINGVELQSSSSNPDECTQGIGSTTIEGVGGLEPYLYFWPTLDIYGPHANNLTSGSYPYSITDAQGCIFEGVTIVDQMGLEVELEVLDSSDDICELGMGEMLVQATSGTAPFTFNWANSSSVSALGTNLLTGLQSVVATDFNGCQGEISYFIENIPPPIAEFTYLLDSCTNELTLFNETDDIVSSLWKVGENLTSTQQHTSVSLHEGGVYPVTLITANEYCADTLTNVIDLTHTSAFNRIKFANVFTPNGDLTNDYFTIRGLKDCDHGVFRIFNRWGKEMYYSIDPLLEPWDGNHLGFEVSEGAYFYVLDLKTIQLKGVLNLYR